MPTKKNTQSNVEVKFPSINLLYDIAISTYELSLKRYDAIENRIQSILVIVLQTTLLFISIGIGLKIQLVSPWILLGVVYGIIAVGIGIYSKTFGEIKYLTTKKYEVIETFAKKSEFDFKNQIIQDSYKHFNENKRLIDQKHDLLIGILLSFSLEILSLLFWFLSSSKNQ